MQKCILEEYTEAQPKILKNKMRKPEINGLASPGTPCHQLRVNRGGMQWRCGSTLAPRSGALGSHTRLSVVSVGKSFLISLPHVGRGSSNLSCGRKKTAC